ncbi:MAG: hypothetical protein KDB53_05415 [Planctomycetes bacterium]|nr:hypothetical protein [Planctomycetota bacterium]
MATPRIHDQRHLLLARQGGGILIWVLGMMMLLVALTAGVLNSAHSSAEDHRQQRENKQLFYLAEAALENALSALGRGASGDIGSAAEPVKFVVGNYWVRTERLEKDTYRITSTARLAGRQMRLEIVARDRERIDAVAMFSAGRNADEAPPIRLSGQEEGADHVIGGVTARGLVELTGDARVEGAIRAVGPILGSEGTRVKELPIHRYELPSPALTGFIDLRSVFETRGDLRDVDRRVHIDHPARMFVLHPENRRELWESTPGPDFFLEPDQMTAAQIASRVAQVVVKTTDRPRSLLILVPGNLWVCDLRADEMRIVAADGSPLQITFAATGSVFLGDDIRRSQPLDAFAFVALGDHLTDSPGNIHIGDAVDQRLSHLDAFLFAHQDITGLALDGEVSPSLEIVGKIHAGHAIRFDRPLDRNRRTRLDVRLDSRLDDGSVELLGIPILQGGRGFDVLSWREVLDDE